MEGIKRFGKMLSMKRVLLPALTLLALIYPLGTATGYLMAALIVVICALCELPAALYAYVFLFWMDEVMPFPLLGGSVVRVMQLALGVRLLLCILKTKAQIRWSDAALAAFVAAACGVGVITHGISGETLSFGLNMAIFCLIRVALRGRTDAPDVVRGMLRTYTFGALAAIATGFVQQRFVTLLLEDFTSSYARFMGTFEPNFMAAFLSAAILIWMALDWKQPIVDALALGVMGGALISTYSMTGMFCFALASLFMIFSMRKEIGRVLLRIARAIPVALAVVALFTAFVSLRGMDYFARGIITEDMHDHSYKLTYEDYVYARDAGIPFLQVSKPASEWISEEQRQEEVDQQIGALSNSVQQNALFTRIREAFERIARGDLDELTSGRYGLARMKLADIASLPAWQRVVGTGPDAIMTYQVNVNQINYTHNSWIDSLYSFGVIGMLLLICWIARAMKQRRFADVQLTGSTAMAIRVGRAALILSGLTLSMHINRTFLFFLFMG